MYRYEFLFGPRNIFKDFKYYRRSLRYFGHWFFVCDSLGFSVSCRRVVMYLNAVIECLVMCFDDLLCIFSTNFSTFSTLINRSTLPLFSFNMY